jgi:Spy/CpxP family protein refolding chaperone
MTGQLKTLFVIFSVVLNLAFIGSYAWRTFQARPRFAYEGLGLSADQRVRFDAARDRFLHNVNQIGDGMIRKHLELIDLVAAEPADDAAIRAKLEEIRSGQRSMQQTVLGHLAESKQLLNPNQRKQFFAVLKERMRTQHAPGPAWLPSGARGRD